MEEGNTKTHQEDPMFTSRTQEELKRLYPGLVARAEDLGVQFDRRTDFDGLDHAAMAAECQELHDKIEAFSAGVDASAESGTDPDAVPEGSGPGLKRLRKDPRARKLRDTTVAEQKQASADAAAEHQESNVTSLNSETNSGSAPRKRAAAKKAAPKKAAKKAAAKKAKAAGRPRTTLDENLKILSAAPNPYRKGGGRHDRYVPIEKGVGKTIKNYLEKGGSAPTLQNNIRLKHVKVG